MTSRLFDAFDMPDWVGTEPVTWRSLEPLDADHQVRGELRGEAGSVQPLDLLAADVAYPKVVCSDTERHDAQQAWQFGEIILVRVDDRVAALVPTRRFDANLACEALRRVAKAVGAEQSSFWVSLSL
jgi:hypothetical protein